MTMVTPNSPPVIHEIKITKLKTVCSCRWFSYNTTTAKEEHERAIAVLEAISIRKDKNK